MTNNQLHAKGIQPAKCKDGLTLLRSELDAVTRLFGQLDGCRSIAQKRAIVQEICQALTIQAQLEDEIVYPALSRALHDSALGPKAKEQQAILRSLIAEVQGVEPGADGYDESVKMISEHVKHHAEQQDQVFSRKRSSSKLDLSELAVQLTSRKQELLAAMSDFGGWD